MYYISGPMSGLPDLNFPAFADCARVLRAHGVTVVSPHEQGGDGDNDPANWGTYVRADIVEMAKHCNAIVLLPGWPDSRGAKLELHVALALNFKVFYWINNQLVSA